MNFKYYNTSTLIPFILLLSVIYNYVSTLLKSLLLSTEMAMKLSEYVDVFSTISLITLTLTFINFIGWRWYIFKWLINIPNLNGRYIGQLVSSYKNDQGHPVIKDCALEIKQTASSIKIYSYYADKGSTIQTSEGFSVSEELVRKENDLFILYYIFASNPINLQTQVANQQSRLHNHEGTCTFKYYLDIRTLEGEYYNQRQNIGTMKVRFEQKKLLYRFAL